MEKKECKIFGKPEKEGFSEVCSRDCGDEYADRFCKAMGEMTKKMPKVKLHL